MTTTSTTKISPATAGTRGRTARVAAGVLGVLWTLFVLPPQVLDWSGRRGTFRWVVTQYDALGYLRLEGWLADRGLDDTYMVFGVAIVLSILLTWWAMRPAHLALGVPGRVLDLAWLALVPLVTISYLSYRPEAPLHALWGTEAFLMLAIVAWSPVAALLARRRGLPRRVLWLVGLTGVVMVLSTLLAGYWPHSTMIGVGVEAVLLALWYPPQRS